MKGSVEQLASQQLSTVPASPSAASKTVPLPSGEKWPIGRRGVLISTRLGGATGCGTVRGQLPRGGQHREVGWRVLRPPVS